MSDVLVNPEAIAVVGPNDLARLRQLALASPRRRARLCLHRSGGELPHEMLIVVQREAYLPPHRHPVGRCESYHVVAGAMLVHLFDDTGRVTRTLRLAADGGDFLYRLSAPLWHMPVPLTEWLVYHEVYTGPFARDHDVEFPSWAPAEADPAGIGRFRASLPASP